MTRCERAASLAAAAIVAAGLTACGGSSGSGSSAATAPLATTASSAASSAVPSTAAAPASVVAVLHAPGHDPHVGNWPITVTLTNGGRPIPGHVSYQFLFQGQVVSRQPVRLESPNFVGTFHDTIIWPATSVGYPLTFRVVIQTPFGVKNVDYLVQVRR